VTLIGDDNPKVDCLLHPQFLVVPLLFHSNGAICFNCHPGIIVANFERFAFRLLLQLKDISAFGVTVGFSKFDALRWSHGTGHTSLLSAVLFVGDFGSCVREVLHMDNNVLIVSVCKGNVQMRIRFKGLFLPSLTFRFACRDYKDERGKSRSTEFFMKRKKEIFC
jgi:hypothetical protein